MKSLSALTAACGLVLLTVGCAAIRDGSAFFDPSAGLTPEFETWIASAALSVPCEAVTGDVLAAQISTESGFRTTAVSPAGAVGPAQFMPETWATWGIDANGDGVADATSIADATAAQAAFLCDSYQRAEAGIAAGSLTGDPLDLALAAYNAGFGAVERFGGMPSGGQYSSETQPYVQKIRERTSNFAHLA